MCNIPFLNQTASKKNFVVKIDSKYFLFHFQSLIFFRENVAV